MGMRWEKWKYFWSDKLCQWLAWRLPRRLAYWAFIRVHSHATCTVYRDKSPDEITWVQAAAAWSRS